MGPLAGTMICDYYLIKRQKLKIDELYADKGIYWYSGGWNWRAFVSFVAGFAPLLPGFAKSIDHSLDIGGAWKVYTFAWTFGFCTSVLVHYIVCTYVSVPRASMVDEAVYPPQQIEEIEGVPEGEDLVRDAAYTGQEKSNAEMV